MALFLLNFNNVDLLTVGIAVAGMVVLGFAVLFTNPKSVSNKIFFCLASIAGTWGVINYLSYQPYSMETSFWLLRFVMFFAVWSSFFTFTFSIVFPADTIKIPRYYKWIIVPLTLITSILTLTSSVFMGVKEFIDGRITQVVNGPGIFVFGLMTIFLNLGAIVSLLIKIKKADQAQRKPLRTILYGILTMLFLIIIFNFLLPAFFDNSSFIPLGAVFLFPFIVFTSYAIMKQKVFNTRVMGTAALVFILSIVTFSEIIIAKDLTTIIYRTGVFSLVLIFGTLLIKEVLREVRQKEELQVLTKKLEAANEKLQELDHLKSEFLSFASHQIKAPLAAIKGFATLIYDGTYGQIPDKVKDAALKIKDSADRMVQLVGDFLNVRKIEEGKMVYKMERVDAVKIISSIFEELKMLAQNKKLDFNLESSSSGGWINADPQNIRQVFQNLIENAIKYTDSGFVTVRTESIAGKFIFSVSDSGRGISKELLPHLFEEFRRDALATGKIEGTGLGLYIAHQITIDHGGEIWVESDGPGKGSKFLVKLPLA